MNPQHQAVAKLVADAVEQVAPSALEDIANALNDATHPEPAVVDLVETIAGELFDRANAAS